MVLVHKWYEQNTKCTQPPLSSDNFLSSPLTSSWYLHNHSHLSQFCIYFLHEKCHRSLRLYLDYSFSLFKLSRHPIPKHTHSKIIALNSSDFLLTMTVVMDMIRNFTKHKCSLFLLSLKNYHHCLKSCFNPAALVKLYSLSLSYCATE